jgi:tRNA A-37 threonylcarbamoyl transferase component Bud32
MAYPTLTDEDFVAIVSDVLGRPIDRVQIRAHVRRLYSEVWSLDAYTDGTALALVAKSWNSDADFERQVAALRQARAVSVEDGTCIPYLGSVKPMRLLLMARVADPTIAALCRVSLRAPARIPYLCDRRDWLSDACTRAGQWLQEWHTRTAANGMLTPALKTYLANRRDCLAVLTDCDRRRIAQLVESVGSASLCTPHGDFTPPNVLWSPQRLTILDFGVSEWKQMSPCWDCISFEVGLHRALRFSIKGIGSWSPGVVTAAVAGFRKGYGASVVDSRVRTACLAIRHLVLYVGDIRRGGVYRRRAFWHRREMQRALDDAVRYS